MTEALARLQRDPMASPIATGATSWSAMALRGPRAGLVANASPGYHGDRDAEVIGSGTSAV